MASVSELVQCITRLTGEQESKVRQVARKLLDDAVLPKSAGAHIAPVSAAHAAKLLVAVLTAPAVKDATRMVDIYGALPLGGSTDAEAVRCGDLLAALIWSMVTEQPTPERLTLAICLSTPDVLFYGLTGDDSWSRHDTWSRRFKQTGNEQDFWQADAPQRLVIVPTKTLVELAKFLRYGGQAHLPGSEGIDRAKALIAGDFASE